MARPRRKELRRQAQDELGPTPERRSKGDLARLTIAIADEAGGVARPYRAADTLDLMLRNGRISPAMRQAGEDFRALFTVAHLDPLRAPDLRRVPQAIREIAPSVQQSDARKKIWQALRALGGAASPAGSCVWHVVGCQWTLKQWALREGWGGRPLNPETASGILIGGLGVLQAFYGL
jgi:hypothetical protein